MTWIASLGATAVLAHLLEHLGTVEGRVRLQKLLYLLKASGVQELARVEFKYHHYGPYSESVTNALMQALARGLMEESALSFEEEWQRYSYQAGRDSQDLKEASALLSQSSVSRIDEVADRTRGLHWRVLELAATMDFLRRTERLSEEQAKERALRLKPHGQPYVDDAERLLGELRLAGP